ncbi:DMSO/selenate family reductase complex B subunit [Limnochorda pilosa]|uniref:4Fe-4S ferredoxin n=1 Tax=Limnochorda pilosa TaxID=1555112 RepID=A0A0K2SGK1_LIMPI|nr:DMSO/selenate family reductase complex B subunit [Limnochorda pilosa]BAS26236.1 4Fe-4S ferredoxin [Limnochorda pilosa]
MGQLGFYVDMTACIGCRTCQVACKDKNNLDVGALYRRVYTFEGGTYPRPWVYHLSMGCNHCEEPRCVENCPTGALTKRPDGLVVLDKDACIGCRYCVWSCPYGAPQYIEAEGRVGKCDGCADLVDQGLNPACVDACPMRAIEFGDVDELRRKHGGTDRVKGMPDPALTHPAVTVKPKAEAAI